MLTSQYCITRRIVEHINVKTGMSNCSVEDTFYELVLCWPGIKLFANGSRNLTELIRNIPLSNPNMNAPIDENIAQTMLIHATVKRGFGSSVMVMPRKCLRIVHGSEVDNQFKPKSPFSLRFENLHCSGELLCGIETIEGYMLYNRVGASLVSPTN
jgi:hypothetical protein